MAEENLKKKTVSSLVWSACQRFGTLFLAFVGNLILARFLTPNDYGLIGMLTVFISLSETFIDSGLGSALIQKNNPTEEDYSTVFWTNITVSIFCYTILFFLAPYIAKFFGIELLEKILKIKGLVLIIQAFRIIQTTKFQKELNFKHLSIVYFICSLISTITSIVLAFLGFGVWSLVAKTLVESSLKTIILVLLGKWKPLLCFSWQSFKSLFSYGGVMLLTSLVLRLYSSMQSLLIGKTFSAQELGYYTQAAKLEEVPTTAMEGVVNQVTFPVFSKIKDEKEKIQNGLKKILNCVSYVSFPLMVFFIICAEPIFDFLFTDIWKPSIPYFKYLCLVGMMVSVNTINTNLIKATGKKREYFNLQVTKRIFAMILLVLSLKFGMKGLLIARVIIEYAFFIANGRVTKRVIGYKIIEQLKDCIPNYLVSFFVGFITFLVFRNSTIPNFWKILTEGIFFFGLYILLSLILKLKAFYTYKDIIDEKFKRK